MLDSAFSYILLEPFEVLGIILFEPVVLDRALKAELIGGESLHEGEILLQGVGQEFAYGLLYRPVPLGVKVCICSHIDCPARILGGSSHAQKHCRRNN